MGNGRQPEVVFILYRHGRGNMATDAVVMVAFRALAFRMSLFLAVTFAAIVGYRRLARVAASLCTQWSTGQQTEEHEGKEEVAHGSALRENHLFSSNQASFSRHEKCAPEKNPERMPCLGKILSRKIQRIVRRRRFMRRTPHESRPPRASVGSGAVRRECSARCFTLPLPISTAKTTSL